MSASGTDRLLVALRAQGGTLAEVLVTGPPSRGRDGDPDAAASGDRGVGTGGDHGGDRGPAQIAARGPRAASREAEYELLLEMILEGSRLHYGRPRVVRTEDPDLALLLGDQLYALGLSRLAALKDLDAVLELADVISLVAQAHVAGDPGLADAVWEAGAVAVGWGPSPALQAAKALVREGDPTGLAALRESARREPARASGSWQ
ncbi:MAG: hypothetical protein ACR2QA_11215 [Solirubrobacteraceae bacterium]